MSFETMESLRGDEGLSVSRFCEWMGLPRSTYYYRRLQSFDEGPERGSKTRLDPRLRERSRELALAHPMYGYRKKINQLWQVDITWVDVG